MSPTFDYIVTWANTANGGGSDYLPSEEVKFTEAAKDIHAFNAPLVTALQNFLYGEKKALSTANETVTNAIVKMENVMRQVEALLQHKDVEAQMDKLVSEAQDSTEGRSAYRSLLKDVEGVKTALNGLTWQSNDVKALKKTKDDLTNLWNNDALGWLGRHTNEWIDSYVKTQKEKEILQVDFEQRRRDARGWIKKHNDPDWLTKDVMWLKDNSRHDAYTWEWYALEWWNNSHSPNLLDGSSWGLPTGTIREEINSKVGPFILQKTKARVENDKVVFPGDKDDLHYYLFIRETLENHAGTDVYNQSGSEYMWKALAYSARQRWIHCGLQDVWDAEESQRSDAGNVVLLYNRITRASRILFDSTIEIDELGSVFFEPLNTLIEELKIALYDLDGNMNSGSVQYAQEDSKAVLGKMGQIRFLSQKLNERKHNGYRPAEHSDNKYKRPDTPSAAEKVYGISPGRGNDWIYGINTIDVWKQANIRLKMLRSASDVPYFGKWDDTTVEETRLRWLKFPEHVIPRINYGTCGDFNTATRHPTDTTWEWDIKYDRRFPQKTPVVRTWLNYFDMQKEQRQYVRVDEVNGAQDGFTLRVTTNEGNARTWGVGTGWFAYDADDPDVWSDYYTPEASNYSSIGQGWDSNYIERPDRGRVFDFPSGKYKSSPEVMIALKAMDFETKVNMNDSRGEMWENVRLTAEEMFLTRDRLVLRGGTWDKSFMRNSMFLAIACN